MVGNEASGKLLLAMEILYCEGHVAILYLRITMAFFLAATEASLPLHREFGHE